MVYGLSKDGSEDSILHILTVADGKDLPEQIPNTEAAHPQWLEDSSGFFYNQLTGRVDTPERYLDSQARFHRLGTEPVQHCCVLPEVPLHSENANPERLFHAFDGNEAYSGTGTTGAGVRRPRPARPSRTSQKPSSPNATAGAQGLTWDGTFPLATSPTMLLGCPTR